MTTRTRLFGDQARSVALLWRAEERSRRGPKPGMSVARIVDAAIAIADADGLEAVSMERVAREFGFTTMSLYRYVPGKGELIDLMIEHAVGAPPALTGPAGAWRAKLESWARALWAGFHVHPWVLAATGRLRVMGPNELSWLEAGLGALAETGLNAGQRHAACLAVLGQVRSMAQFSVAMPQGRRGISGEQWSAATRELVRDHAARYPHLSATLADGGGKEDPLGFGLACVLDGIGLLVAGRAPKPRRSNI
jgi:AcrR family transcriptional regulator